LTGINCPILHMKKRSNFLSRYSQCIAHEEGLYKTTRKTVVLEERGRRYCLENRSGLVITKVKVEGCVTSGHNQKGCEAILVVETVENNDWQPTKAFFVELKGCAVRDALKQLDNTYETTKSYLMGIALFGRIVPSQYKRTKFLDTYEQKLRMKFKNTGGNLIIKEQNLDIV
jgi:hypothetical protein